MTTGRRPPLDEQVSLFQSTVAVEGITTGAGAAAGTSIIDAGLIGAGANSFVSMLMVLYPGLPLQVDSQDITAFNNVTGEITFAGAYKGVAAAIPAGVSYKIITFRFVPAEVAALTALVVALVADIEGATGTFHEQEDTPFNVNAVLAAEANILNLAVADTRYIVRSLRLKCVDPGIETVTVRLYELVNDAGPLEVDSFLITNANFGTYHSLMDMFGLPHLAGDELQVTVQASAVGPYAVTGQYSMGKTNV